MVAYQSESLDEERLKYLLFGNVAVYPLPEHSIYGVASVPGSYFSSISTPSKSVERVQYLKVDEHDFEIDVIRVVPPKIKEFHVTVKSYNIIKGDLKVYLD